MTAFRHDDSRAWRVEIALQRAVRVAARRPRVERQHAVLADFQPHVLRGVLQEVAFYRGRRESRYHACALAHAALPHRAVQPLHVARLRQRSRSVQQVTAHVVVVLLTQRPPVVLIALLKHRLADIAINEIVSLRPCEDIYLFILILSIRWNRNLHGKQFPLIGF